MNLHDVELEIHRAFQEQLQDVNPRLLVTASKLYGNQRAAVFSVMVLPFHYFEPNLVVPARRLGAKWRMFVSNVDAWPLTERAQLINIVVSEITQYIKQGTIDREEHTTHDFDGSRYRVQRFGNPTN